MSNFQHTYSGGESKCSHCGGWTRGANLKTECPARLRAEVDRLQGEVQQLGCDKTDIDHAYDFARNKATVLERAAVVAWLRREVDDDGDSACILAYAANGIERGEHRREETK